jgi:protein ImuA
LDQQPFKTVFDAAALVASEISTSVTGSAAAPLVDPVTGCAFKGSGQPLSKAALPKQALIGALRAAITKIEGHAVYEAESSRPQLAQTAWRLGCAQVDRLLPQGLDVGGVHEVKSVPQAVGASAGDWMTSLGFALRLAVRRASMMSETKAKDALKHDALKNNAPWLLWCWPRALASEFGAPSMLGLAHLGLDPSRLLIVETARAAEALVALEDGLKSSSLVLAFGIFDEIALTPARRLSLAAAASGTPCLLITHPVAEATAATSTRWRVQRQLSAPHAYDARAPGNTRFLVNLERCRSEPQSAGKRPLMLEWSHETRNFSLASGLANGAAGTGASRRRSA